MASWVGSFLGEETKQDRNGTFAVHAVELGPRFQLSDHPPRTVTTEVPRMPVGDATCTKPPLISPHPDCHVP